MARDKEREKQVLLNPRARVDDVVKVYKNSFFKKNSDVDYESGRRVVHIDPEVVYRFATLGMSREMICAYWGIKMDKFREVLEEYPEVEEAYLMGMSSGLAKTAMALEKQIEGGNMVSTIFRMKIGGFIEADKRKDAQQDNSPRVQIFLPSNGRDIIEHDDIED